ncbi:MAG: prolyl oligopeptidase family serine peptidase [Asgard group archaeon]|nr:prolyl oligopeptidase family serine peptidase [Asgard group archaeon]
MLAWIITLIILGSSFVLLISLIGVSFTKYLFITMINKKRFLQPKEEISYLTEPPIIDGRLEKSLGQIPIRRFNARVRLLPFQRSSNPSYRLAYGRDFLYIYIELEAKTIIKRDRGFQNGDGFHMLIANPKQNNRLTDEFFVLGFSPNEDSEGSLEKYIWYHDTRVQLSKLGVNTQFAVTKFDKKIGYELLLPWEEIYPYHPWFLERGLGFNLAFIKAKKSFFEYFPVIMDWRFQAENQKRKYALMTMEMPRAGEELLSYIILDRNSQEGIKAKIYVTTIASKSNDDQLHITISTKEEEILTTEKIPLNYNAGIQQHQFEYQTEKLTPGSYMVQWQLNTASGEKELTVLPRFNYEELITQLANSKEKLLDGSYQTLQFVVEQLNQELKQIKWYENYPELMTTMVELLTTVQKALNDEDVLKFKTGTFRRAFISKIDSTVQPYSITIPKNYDPTRKYPLIVFLHGSGVDDRNALKLIDYIEGDYIKLAPKTRGSSHYFGKKETLIDIIEVINDVKENYSINEGAIILGGFSMGGYGVYRTFMEYPKLFKGLMILSGEPKINFFIRMFTKGKFVNFLKEKNLRRFQNIPMFIFHGTLDKNCPYKDTAILVEKLQQFNTKVDFHNDVIGHKKIVNQSIIKHINDWTNRITSE